jgi:hypothetical protein
MTGLTWSALVIGATLTLLLFAFVVRRLIGVRVPVPRTLAAGVVAVLVFSPIVTAMIGGPGFPRKGSVLPALWFVILRVARRVRRARKLPARMEAEERSWIFCSRPAGTRHWPPRPPARPRCRWPAAPT